MRSHAAWLEIIIQMPSVPETEDLMALKSYNMSDKFSHAENKLFHILLPELLDLKNNSFLRVANMLNSFVLFEM